MEKTEIRYHPLIDADSEGMEKVPLFLSTDEDIVKNSHSMYLTEIISNYYRLYSKGVVNHKNSNRFRIHCPLCGSNLMQISLAYDTTRLGLYTCDRCRS